jgi:DNA gyrase subunit B
MTKQYTHEDIKVLDEISHIRLNACMYIGETNNPVHLVEEALDNALDECMGGYCKTVAVNINTKEHIYCIIDNGRGIPIENDTPITISTKLFSGAKFQDSKTAYNVSSGLHGVGLVAILALSDMYVVEIYKDNTHAKFIFENQKLKSKLIEPFNEKVPFSTKIQFKPSKKIFETLIPEKEIGIEGSFSLSDYLCIGRIPL